MFLLLFRNIILTSPVFYVSVRDKILRKMQVRVSLMFCLEVQRSAACDWH